VWLPLSGDYSLRTDGLEAEIKKPPFDPVLEKNERIQGKPRELRVYVDDQEMSEEEVFRTAAEALVKFYSDDEINGD
jgi:hypothetical protein